MRTFELPITYPLHLSESPTSPLIQPVVAPIHIGLFRDVTNAKQLKNYVIHSGTLAESINEEERLIAKRLEGLVFLNANMILDPFHLLTAIYRALVAERNNKMKTRNVGSEIIYSLSPGTNVTDGFKRFGLNDTTKNIVVVRVLGGTLEKADEDVHSLVNGVEIDLELLEGIRDLTLIKKIYKIEDEVSPEELSKMIAEGVALKGLL
ncbi:kinase binding protein CGI-121-domain-containing protein [Paraphysoderma sedebokerense]|nr:kinase binding protein CGI-121-domain-containing protein [Paraphysoderma sedebokerense]